MREPCQAEMFYIIEVDIDIMYDIIDYDIDIVQGIDMDERSSRHPWVDELNDEDVAFVKRFVLASGSLKELAKAYGISYPTIRLRLDRLIEKVKILDDQTVTSGFEKRLRVLYSEGKIDMDTLKALLAAHRQEMEADHENRDRAD